MSEPLKQLQFPKPCRPVAASEYSASFDAGQAFVSIPGNLSADDVQGIEELFTLILRRLKRLAAANKKDWLLTEKISLLKERP